jgi:hypothetical protein
MDKVVQFPFQVASSEMITKPIRAGYLKPAQRHDADAVTKAIVQMKQDDDGPNAACPPCLGRLRCRLHNECGCCG